MRVISVRVRSSTIVIRPHLAYRGAFIHARYGGRWNRQPSLRLTGSYRDEISRYSRTLVQAGSSDGLVRALAFNRSHRGQAFCARFCIASPTQSGYEEACAVRRYHRAAGRHTVLSVLIFQLSQNKALLC